MNYKNREQYKHLMRVLAVAAIVLLECAVFSVFWDRYYASHLWLEPFWDKGNQIIVVIYGIFLLVFMYIYGGMKIGYMKGSSIIYSQMMTAFCANALMYLQDDNKMPRQVVLRNLVLMNQANQMGSSGDAMVTKQKLAEQLKYCIVVVSAAPLLVVYPFIQKYFAKGVTIGAVKG